MNKLIYFGLIFLLSASCQQESNEVSITKKSTRVESGKWKFSFLTQKHEIPIRIVIQSDSLFIHNASEKIALSFTVENDSFYVAIPNFDSHMEGVIQSNKQLKGIYVKDYVEDYTIPFIAVRSDEAVFETINTSSIGIKNKYATTFFDNEDSSPAIGLFEQNNGVVTGSFATETGDYRFLEGLIDGNTLRLSTFDGSHLFLFTAEIKEDSLINGVFISGKGGSYKWSANFDNDAALRDPEKLTYLENEVGDFDFDLVDLNNDRITLDDPLFNGKIKIIQIMGTWCPNCLDESNYFNEIYPKYKSLGLEIIAVAFENGNDTLKVLENLKKYKENNNIEYTLLYGGKASSKVAGEVFPMLNKIMSFPTAIYVDESNKVRKIYTGFYGPGTGEYYSDYTSSTEKFIESLIEELNQ